jgi:5'-nucleotidase
MRILVTNDDGLGAEGLEALAGALSIDHEVWVFAPDRERSGVSHALTLGAPGKVRKVGDRAYSCSGTPADCVVFTMLGAIDFKPELVVSGINRGPNLGTDIVYSGTCGAASEAVLSGIPGIAVSCASHDSRLHYGAAASFVRMNLASLAAACQDGAFVNVNAPSSECETLLAYWSDPCARVYGNRLRSFDGPDGLAYHFITGGESGSRASPTSDHEIVAGGSISVSVILAQPQASAGVVPGREFR